MITEYEKIEGVVSRCGVLLGATNNSYNIGVMQLVGHSVFTVSPHGGKYLDVVPASQEEIAYTLSKPGDRVEIYVNKQNQATLKGFKNLTLEQGDINVEKLALDQAQVLS